MTNLQLLLSIGLPSLIFLATWSSSNLRISRIETKLDSFEAKLGSYDGKFDSFEAKLADIKESQHADSLLILKTMTELHERVAVVETKVGLR